MKVLEGGKKAGQNEGLGTGDRREKQGFEAGASAYPSVMGL